jgi:choline dehydrogenase-like flavoprotein
MFFDRGSAVDYDAWESLGNDGWAWEDLLPYFKKAGFSKSELPN